MDLIDVLGWLSVVCIAATRVLWVGSRLADLPLPDPRQPHAPDTANALD